MRLRLSPYTARNNEVRLRAHAAKNSRAWFYATEIASIYNFPKPNLTKPVVVGVVSLGGGLIGTIDAKTGVLTNGDVQKYWANRNIPANQMPKVIVIPLNGARNVPNPRDSATIENTIDIQTIGACCPSSSLTILFFLAPNTMQGFTAIFTKALQNPVSAYGKSYNLSILSVSWGAPEIYFSRSNLNAINALCQQAAQKGITICVATGDNGSNDGVGGRGAYTDFPSSSPNVLACGGTSLFCPNFVYDASTKETAWSSGGGGISAAFPKPTYQSRITANGRAIPDIALNADPKTGVVFLIGGTQMAIGGTSIVAPAAAAYLACLNMNIFFTPLLYSLPSTVFHDIIIGSNGAYSAKLGYDASTGFGSINGQTLATQLLPLSIQTVASKTLTVGQTHQIVANYPNMNLTYVSSAPTIATVSTSGLVRALKKGTAIITTNVGNLASTTSVVVN